MSKFMRFVSLIVAILCGMGFPGCSSESGAADVGADTSGLPPAQRVFDAARRGDLETLKTVIESEPMLVDARDDTGSTLLHVAVESKHANVVKYLVEQGAQVTATDGQGRTPDEYGKELDVSTSVREALFQ